MKHIYLVLFILLFSACQPMDTTPTPEPIVPLPDKTPPLKAQAHMDVINFYVNLNHGKYDNAVELYGGSYEMLQGWNPDLDPSDKAGLLKRGCEQNGLMCLQLYSADLLENTPENEFTYEVSFRNPDNSRFVLSPCCGADETEMPPITFFEVHVICTTEGYTCKVLELPPYVP